MLDVKLTQIDSIVSYHLQFLPWLLLLLICFTLEERKRELWVLSSDSMSFANYNNHLTRIKCFLVCGIRGCANLIFVLRKKQHGNRLG